MGKLLSTCLKLALTITIVNLGLMGPGHFAHAEGESGGGEVPLGGPTSTKSFVPLACDVESIKGQLQPDDPKKSDHEMAAKACHGGVKKTDTACQPGSNPSAQQAQGQANQYSQQTNQASLGAAGSGGGQSNNCGGMGDLMKNMQPPMQQYNAQCAAARETCKTSCEAASKRSETACASIKDPKKKIACEANANIVKQCNTKTAGACESYSQQTAAILEALKTVAMQMMQMQKCQEDQGLDCAKDPTNVQCLKDDTVKCTDPKNYSNPTCICQANPSAAGCPGADSRKLSDIAGRDPNSRDSESPSTALPTLSDSTGLDGNKRGASAGGAPGMGAGGGVGGGAGGGRGVNDPTNAGAGAKPANPDVLSGDYGGGGGGRGGMGGGYPEATNSGLGAALKNADARKTASAAGSLTGANGRSNWQKVRERYRDNRPSLMEQGK